MAARSIWNAIVRLDALRLPVKMYSGVEDRGVAFHMLHDADAVRLKQRMVNPDTGETVPRERMRKGFEAARNLLVVFEESELESLAPKESRDIQILGFVEPSAIRAHWFDRPYWLGPDQNTDEYFAFTAALTKRGLEGIARWVMRGKEYVGAMRADGDHLSLITLRHAEDSISVGALEAPSGRTLDKQELELAEKLIAALRADFEPSDYHDDHRQRVLDLIETKRKGGTVKVREYEAPPPTESLAAALRASLRGLK